MEICKNCKVLVSNITKHIRRKRCEVQHIKLTSQEKSTKRNYIPKRIY
jgi:hypothetical protein